MARTLQIVGAALALGTAAFAADPATRPRPFAQAPAAQPASPATLPGDRTSEGYVLQELDEPVERLKPVEPRSSEKQSRLDAASWYMAGRLLESRNEQRKALDAYRKAVEADPEATDVYRSLVPLLFKHGQAEEAIRYALKAAELDPEDYELLRQIGVHMASQQKFDDAVRLFEQAAEAAAKQKDGDSLVMLKRDLGILYAAVGQPDKAADSYQVVFDALARTGDVDIGFRTRAALLADPRTSYEQIGQVFLAANRPEPALKAFQLAAQQPGRAKGDLSYNLALVYFKTGKHEESLQELQKYFDAQRQSKGRDAYQLLADILKEQKQEDRLIARLEALLEKDEHNLPLQHFLADKYADSDQLQKAADLYKKALKHSADAAGYIGLAGVYRRLKQPAELLDALSRALEKAGAENLQSLSEELSAVAEDKELATALLATGRGQAAEDPPKLDFEESYLLAKVSVELKQPDDAILFYQRALDAGNRERDVLIYREYGLFLLEHDRYTEAAELLDQAVKASPLSPVRPDFLFLLSHAREMNGETKAALEAVAEAKKIVTEPNLRLEYQEAWIHYHSRDWEKAIAEFEEVIEKFPPEEEQVRRAKFSVSNIYVQQGDIRKGEEILEKILEQNPDDPSVNNDLGYLYADQGKNLEKAEKMIRLALEAEPENPAYLDSLGWVLFKQGKFDQAVEWLRKAVDHEAGGDATIWDHLGDAYEQLGKTSDAVQAWEKALEQLKKEARPDEKLAEKLEAKLKKHRQTASPPAEPKAQ